MKKSGHDIVIACERMCIYACAPERAMASADFMLASSVKADGRGSEALQL